MYHYSFLFTLQVFSWTSQIWSHMHVFLGTVQYKCPIISWTTVTTIQEWDSRLTMEMRSSGVQTTSEGPLDVRRNPICLPSDNPDMPSFSSSAPTTDIIDTAMNYEVSNIQWQIPCISKCLKTTQLPTACLKVQSKLIIVVTTLDWFVTNNTLHCYWSMTGGLLISTPKQNGRGH